MTWGIRIQRLAFALIVVAALALASGANWIDLENLLGW
jgi:hypothetical protein